MDSSDDIKDVVDDLKRNMVVKQCVLKWIR